MDVAVTGSSGLIGQALTRSLTSDGHRVIALVRRAPKPGEEAIEWDPTSGTLDSASLEGIDTVVHLAGAGIGDHRWTIEYKRRILESRTRTTSLLATTLADLDRPPSVLVSGSAIGYYGDRGEELLTEKSEPGASFLADVCIAWESAAQPAVDAGIRVPLIRTGIVLTRDGGALAKLLPLFRLGLGGRMGSGRQWWSWISLDDEIRAIRFLLDHERVDEEPLTGPVNLTSPAPVTNAAFTKVLAKVLGRPGFMAVPAFGPKLLRGSELADELLFTSERVEPAVLTRAGFEFGHPDLEAALRAILDRPETSES